MLPKRTTKKAIGFYMSKEWRKVRQQILQRDNFTCTRCLCKFLPKDLQVDHIQPLSTHPHLSLYMPNLRTLCRSCHTRLPTSMGRNSNYKEKPFIGLDGLPEGW